MSGAHAPPLPQRGDSDPNHLQNNLSDEAQYDMLTGLWLESPFIRLPADAPPELEPYVCNIDNPYRVYVIHRASRRHDFQLLVELYIHQLRDGCGVGTCLTPTCLTFRRLLAGKAPVRRYNPTSARTLAVHLASQDNPERGICPNLKRSKDVTPTVRNLVFCKRKSHKSKRPDHDAQMQKQRRDGHSYDTNVSFESVTNSSDRKDASRPTEICVSERPVRFDHRSFSATTFSTVAFKMLEWLTPNSYDFLSKRVFDLKSSLQSTPKQAAELLADVPIIQDTDIDNKDKTGGTGSPQSSSQSPHPDASNAQDSRLKKENLPPHPDTISFQDSRHKLDQLTSHPETNCIQDTRHKKDHLASKQNSRASFRSLSSVETARRKSIEPVSVTTETDNTPLHRSTRINRYHPDKLSKRSKSPTAIGLKPPFFENVPIPPLVVDKANVNSSGGGDSAVKRSIPQYVHHDSTHQQKQSQQSTAQQQDDSMDDMESTDYLLPQSLTHLNVDIINFISDVYAEDQTYEDQFFSASRVSYYLPQPLNSGNLLARRTQNNHHIYKSQWKAFHEQTLFNILSDPASLVSSFTQNGDLFDSHTLWYCMVRLTRASPSLVLHSLWLSAACLFEPSGSAKQGEKDTFRHITDFQAQVVMCVCLHALVALVPVVSDSRALYNLSRVRSFGYALLNSNTAYRRMYPLCIDYNDVFSNNLAIRLARRLFLAIASRHRESSLPLVMRASNKTVLDQLLKQLDLSCPRLGRILDFDQDERFLHETRVPTLLLDWARTILQQEWDGEAVFDKKGAFFGALLFIDTLYLNKGQVFLAEPQFIVDSFAERLDAMRAPVEWLATESVDGRGNLLDCPYLFRPEAIVAFFRSINFSSMSRAFEEASSLKRRMNAIVDPGSLITNPHHQVFLKDHLKLAASKYLVLDIGRETVLRDAFDQLWRRQKRELLRPLKIRLGENMGEEGIDSGGVQQEFFRLAIAECLDPIYGAFTVDENTHMAWFKPQAGVENWKFELIGLLMSLAVYNGLTLPVNFPKAFYRKLLGQPVDNIHHISDGWPQLASSFSIMLQWDETDGLVEDVFAHAYEFSATGVGKDFTVNMMVDKYRKKPGLVSDDAKTTEAAPPITGDNRQDFVEDYIVYLTDYSVREQLESFRRGFMACLSEKLLSLFTAPVLQSLVEGEQEIDILELRRCARYIGWDASHRTVRDFWSVVKRYDQGMKRKLLEFVTASDRVPVSGLRHVQFIIQKNGVEEGSGGHLPTAYTCFGTLLLPEYHNKDVLRERLEMALRNSQGFGFA